MRVVFINSVCSYGSTGRIMAELARMLNARGDEGIVAYGRYGAYSDIKTYRIGSNADFYAHALKTRLTDRTGTGSKRATRRLISFLKEMKPDLIHLGNIHGYYIHVKTLFDYLRDSGIPTVWTLHDCWSFTGHCSHFTDVDCDRYRTHCEHCPKRKIYPQSWFFDRSRSVFEEKKRMFTGINNLHLVTPSQWLRDCVAESILKEYPVDVLPNGINLEVFHPTKSDFRIRYHLENRKIALGVATPWDERKGLYDLIALSKRLGDDWKVVLVALTKEQISALPSGILGLERTESAETLAELYSTADVYVNPTYCDTFPTTNLEALACGTPVVTYMVGGSPESLTERCGIAVPKGDLSALTGAVRHAAERFRPEDCIARGNEFSKRERFQAYLALYDSVWREGKQ